MCSFSLVYSNVGIRLPNAHATVLVTLQTIYAVWNGLNTVNKLMQIFQFKVMEKKTFTVEQSSFSFSHGAL